MFTKAFFVFAKSFVFRTILFFFRKCEKFTSHHIYTVSTLIYIGDTGGFFDVSVYIRVRS